jgi:hypothetical protein
MEWSPGVWCLALVQLAAEQSWKQTTKGQWAAGESGPQPAFHTQVMAQ